MKREPPCSTGLRRNTVALDHWKQGSRVSRRTVRGSYRFGTPSMPGEGYAKMTCPFQWLPVKGALLYMVAMYVTARMPEHPGCFASLRLRGESCSCDLFADESNRLPDIPGAGWVLRYVYRPRASSSAASCGTCSAFTPPCGNFTQTLSFMP